VSKIVIQECENYNTKAITEKLNSSMVFIGGWAEFIKSGM